MRTTQVRFVWAKFSFLTLQQVALLHSTGMPSHWLSLIWLVVRIHIAKVTIMPSWRSVRRRHYKGNCVRGANVVKVTLGLLAMQLNQWRIRCHCLMGAMIFLNVCNYQVFNGRRSFNCQNTITNSSTVKPSNFAWMKLFDVSL